MIFLMIFIL